MNFRSTGTLFAGLLTVLWIFGLMTAWRKTVVEEAFVMPSLKAAYGDYDIDRATVVRGDKERKEYEFVLKDGMWKAKVADQIVGVEHFRIRDLVEQVRDARKDDEASLDGDAASYKLDAPMLTVTLQGRPKDKRLAGYEKSWTFKVGSLSPDKKLAYVATSDLPNRVFGVPRSNVKALFFDDLRALRPLRLFNANTPSVKSIDITAGEKALEIAQGTDGLWRLRKPNLGLAEEEGPPLPKGAPPEAKSSPQGVRGLIDAILSIRVGSADDHLVPPAEAARFGLHEGKETLRIVVSGDGKDSRETLLLGNEEGGKRYARMGGDDGIFRIPASAAEPIFKAIASPETLRSMDVAGNETRGVDAVVIRQGKSETALLKNDDKNWSYRAGDASPQKASVDAVRTLLDKLQGRREIREFLEGDPKKLDADKGFDAPTLTISLYADATAKDDKGVASLKKDAAASLILSFGLAEKNRINVKRKSGDVESRFQVDKSWLDAILPSEGTLAFLDRTLPEFHIPDVESIAIDRAGKQLTIRRGATGNWTLTESGETMPGDAAKIFRTLSILAHATAHRWIRDADAKTDLAPFGLKTPALSVSIALKSDRLPPAGAASILASAFDPIGGLASAEAYRIANPTVITFKVGAEPDAPDLRPGLYAQRSGVDRIFLLTPDIANAVRDDFRDRLAMAVGQAALAAASVSAAVQGPEFVSWNAVLGQVHSFDPAAVAELRLAVRTPVELRQLDFKKTGTTWKDASGLQEFQLDSAKVEQTAELIARLRTPRVVSIGTPPRKDQKLDPKEAILRIELVAAGSAPVILTVGSRFDATGYFARSSAWPEAIFVFPTQQVEALLRGAAHFASPTVAQQ